MQACRTNSLTLFLHALIVLTALSAASCQDDMEGTRSSSGGTVKTKFVRMEKMRRGHFSPMVVTQPSSLGDKDEEGNSLTQHHGSVPPVQQAALFREAARQSISSKLTHLLEASRSMEMARQMAKDRIHQRVKEMEQEREDAYGGQS